MSYCILRLLLAAEISFLINAACPPGTWELQENCYFFSYDKRSWHNAADLCEARGNGFLTSVENSFESTKLLDIFDAVGDFIFEDVWSGGNNLDDGTSWQWSDGKPFTFQHWKPGFPTTSDDDQCVSLSRNDGRYVNTNCRELKYFICKYTSSTASTNTTCPTLPPTTTQTCLSCPRCPSEYEIHNGFCYKVTHRPGTSFAEARSICQQEGGELASIHSAEENAYILGLLMMLPPNSVTTDNCSQAPWMWIGLWDPLQNRRWNWTDTTAVEYSNWSSGEPGNSCGGSYCVEMASAYGSQHPGAWWTKPCTYSQAFYVCKQQAR